MTLCYEFERWTILTLTIVAISLTIGLVLMQHGHGQPGAIQQEKESLQALLDYCFQHADRPNPLQDLIDKGFLSPSFKGETCISVRQMIDELESGAVQIEELNKTRLAELEKERVGMEERNRLYVKCARNESTTFEECIRIREGTK